MTEETIKIEEPVEEPSTEERERTDVFEVSGDEVVAKIKSLLREGNIRRVILQTEAGKTLFEIPLTIGLVGVAAGLFFATPLVAVAAIAAVVAKLKIKVKRLEKA